MSPTSLELLNAHACFGGAQRIYQHSSREIGLPMKFSVFLPPQALQGTHGASTPKVPALLYLAGLTCNEETFMTKAGAQRLWRQVDRELHRQADFTRGMLVDALRAAKAGVHIQQFPRGVGHQLPLQ